MRRSILVLLLVTMVIMLLMVAPAFAKTGTKSGGYWAYSAAGQEFYADIHGHYYVFASDTDSPHSGYSTTSGKCKVCHAVHGAGITTTDQTAMQPTEKLLRSTAADACVFCHLGAGAFATDPYAGGPYDSYMNYNGNENNTTFPWGGADVARSGHFKTHGHDNPQNITGQTVVKSYKGCVSCHSVHGANTMVNSLGKPNILKNDPARGVTDFQDALGSPIQASQGWGAGGQVTVGGVTYNQPALEGYGSHEGPVKNQMEFCEDCHDGTKVNPIAGADIPIVSQAAFNSYFPSCGVRNDTGALCHNSVQTAITESVAQFGAFNNTMHNGRSHIMTTSDRFSDTAKPLTEVNMLSKDGNGCATCHNVAAFPHFGVDSNGTTLNNELITGYAHITESDQPCMKCHGTIGGTGPSAY